MLIVGAEVDGALRDVRVERGRIGAIERCLAPLSGERVFDAAGGALLPGLHDHHIHLNAAAAALASVRCGPPEIASCEALVVALGGAPGEGGGRGVGYHTSVAGEIDRRWLDRFGPDRAVRIQHRGGRMWILNSRALALLGDDMPADGRLIDGDALLRRRLDASPPDLRPLGSALAARGVTGLTEATARNDADDYHRYARAGLDQHLLVMGTAALDDLAPHARARAGAVKLHYHDHDLPALDALIDEVACAHAADRAVAAHCVTRAELMLTLAAIEAAGPHPGDRIEHAGVAPPPAVEWIASLGLTVVTQPHFIAERGRAYRAEVAAHDQPWLYRLRGFRTVGVRLAGGSDAPFGGLDPWSSMAAATERDLGPEEVRFTPGLPTILAGLRAGSRSVGRPISACSIGAGPPRASISPRSASAPPSSMERPFTPPHRPSPIRARSPPKCAASTAPYRRSAAARSGAAGSRCRLRPG